MEEKRKQTQEHIQKRVNTRILNNSYKGQNKGHKPTNLKPNSGSFKKGIAPWNKGMEKKLDINFIKREYLTNLKSTYDIAEELNVSNKTIATRLKESGIKLRGDSKRNKTIEVIKRKYENNNITLKELGKEYGLGERSISKILQEYGTKLKRVHTQQTKDKIRETMKRKGIQPKQRFSGTIWNKGLTKEDPRVANNIQGLMENRKFQVLPVKDTSIEVKLQKFLDELKIVYEKHKYMYISHAYQCDIFIPSLNLVLEADGLYYHNYPIGREIDKIRTKELKELGFNVIRLWEQDINKMDLEDFKRLIDNVQAV